MEDLLTSCVFDALRYSNSQEILFNWLKKAETIDGQHPFEYLDSRSKVNIKYWPQLKEEKNICEPDVIIDIGENQDGYSVLIEAKFNSGKSSRHASTEFKTIDQLAIEWVNLVNGLERQKSKRTPMLVYLTADAVIPKKEIRNSLENLDEQHIDAVNRFMWLSWRHLNKLLRIAEEPSIIDLKNLLDRLELTFFDGLHPLPGFNAIEWNYDPMDHPG